MASTKRERDDGDNDDFTIQDYQKALANQVVQITKLQKTVEDQGNIITSLDEKIKELKVDIQRVVTTTPTATNEDEEVGSLLTLNEEKDAEKKEVENIDKEPQGETSA